MNRRYFIIYFIFYSFMFAQTNDINKAKIQSLVLPGWGQQKIGFPNRAKSFFIREATIWFIWISCSQASDWYKHDYKAFAELHADVEMLGKDYLFAVNMGHFNSFADYNENKSRKRQINLMYGENEGKEWNWDSANNRIRFDQMRINSVLYKKYSQFAMGGLVLHRIISLIDIIYLERLNSKISINHEFSIVPSSIKYKINFNL